MSDAEPDGFPAPPSNDELIWLSRAALPRRAPIGSTFVIQAPVSLAARLARPIEAVHLADGRTGLLIRMTSAWKGNFAGFLHMTAPLEPNELRSDGRGRPFISLPAPPPWEELYVHVAHSATLWAVFFDLN